MHYSHPFAAIERKPAHLSKKILSAISICILLLATCWVSLTVLGIYQLAWTGPFRDIWEFIAPILSQLQGQWSWQYLIDAYGGAHRILLPKLVFWADYQFFYGSNFLTISLSLLCQCICLAICWKLLQASTISTWMRRCLLAGFIAAFFHAGQLFNFLYAMDVQWFMANTFALIALLHAAKIKQRCDLWLALFFAIAASLCNFTGLMAVILIAVCGVFFARQQKIQLLDIAFIVICTAYLIWYVKTGKSSDNLILASFLNSESFSQLLFHSLNTLLHIVPFTLKMLSNPLSRDWPITGTSLALLSILFLLQQTWQLRHNSSKVQRILVMWCWYILLGCAFTALGRIFYPNSATAERYLTLTLPYSLLISYLLWLQCRSLNKQVFAALFTLPALIYFYSSTSVKSLENMNLISQQQHTAQVAARTHVVAMEYIRGSLSFPMAKQGHNAVAEFNQQLDQANLAYFRAAPFVRLYDNWQQVIANHSFNTAVRCDGLIHQQQAVSNNKYRMQGQLDVGSSALTHLVLADDDQVVGFAYQYQAIGHWLPWRSEPAADRYFVGFVSAALEHNTYQIMGFDRHGQALCRGELRRD